MNTAHVCAIAAGAPYSTTVRAHALDDAALIASLGKVAQISFNTGGCSLTTYANAAELRALAKMLLVVACDVDAQSLTAEATA